MKRTHSPVLTLMLIVSIVGFVLAVSDPSVTGAFHKVDVDKFKSIACTHRGLCPESFAGGSIDCVPSAPKKIADRCEIDLTPDAGKSACYDYPAGTGTTGHACSGEDVTYVCDDTGFYELRRDACKTDGVCSDSDHGIAVTIKGIVTVKEARDVSSIFSIASVDSSTVDTIYKDHCVGSSGSPAVTSSILREYFCTDDGAGFVDYDCSKSGGTCKDPPGGPDACTQLAVGEVPPPVPCAGIANPCGIFNPCQQGFTCLNCKCQWAPPASIFNARLGYPVIDADCVSGTTAMMYGQARVCTANGAVNSWDVVTPVPAADDLENSFFDVFANLPSEDLTLAGGAVVPAVAPSVSTIPATTSNNVVQANVCPGNTECHGATIGTSIEAVQGCKRLYPQSTVPLGCNTQCRCAPTQG